MKQMNVCPVHIRITVAPGHKVPDVTYKSLLLDFNENSKQKYNSLADLHVNVINETENSTISPMKPSKKKAEHPKEIVVSELSEEAGKEISKKLQGRRKFREISIETFDRKKEQNKDIGKSSDSRSDHMDENGEGKRNEPRKISEKDEIVKNDRKSYYEAASSASYQMLKRSSNSLSNAKDDQELSQILQMSAAVASAASTSRPSSSQGRRTPSTWIDGKMHPGSPVLQTAKFPFFCGNPAVAITHGIVHLYKTNYTLKVGEGCDPPLTKTLCMLAVPATVDTHSILEFTAAFCDTIVRLRIIRDRTPSQYMVLLTFSSEQAAMDFYDNFNNIPYNSLTQDEICRLAFVASVEALPSLQEPGEQSVDEAGLLPIPGSTELPDCVLCLERMDESVRGVLTILCNHSFHGSCLQKWEDLCCPVCRYIQTPEPRSDNKCLVCGSEEDLWICLVCGHVGCGRYTTEHAQQHYLETHHNYAMALSDNRVWDYAGDYFVHRLFQNKDDGKLVEQKGPDPEGLDNKVEAIQLECMYLLTSQLESQRKYWEEKLVRVEERAVEERDAARSELHATSETCKQLTTRVAAMEKEKVHLEKKNSQMSAKYASALHELSTEKELNNGLRKNQDEWRKKVERLEELSTKQQEEISELKEQLRDLMFYLEAQDTVSNADKDTREDIQSGQIVVGAAGGGQQRKRRTKKK